MGEVVPVEREGLNGKCLYLLHFSVNIKLL